MSQLDIIFGEHLKQQGIANAQTGADNLTPDWTNRAYVYLQRFLKQHDGPFLMEQARQYAYEHGLPSPKSERSWGGVAVRAMNAGIVRRIGTGVVSNPNAHKCYASRYIKTA